MELGTSIACDLSTTEMQITITMALDTHMVSLYEYFDMYVILTWTKIDFSNTICRTSYYTLSSALIQSNQTIYYPTC
jgi:hypothetical protein